MPRKFYETKVIQPENERRSYRVLTDAGFQEMIKSICEIKNLKDVEINYRMDSYSVSINVEHSFSVGAALYIDSRIDWRGMNFGYDEDGKWWRIDRVNLKIEVNWSGTSRSLTSAAAAIELYQELISLGNNISAMLCDYDLMLLDEVTSDQMAELKKKVEAK